MAKSVRDIVDNKFDLVTVFIMAEFIIGMNTLAGFLAGCGFALTGTVFRGENTNEAN